MTVDPKSGRQSWPLHVHGVLIVGVCYVASLFWIVPEYAAKLAGHLMLVGVPAWYLGRAMAGAYDKREGAPP